MFTTKTPRPQSYSKVFLCALGVFVVSVAWGMTATQTGAVSSSSQGPKDYSHFTHKSHSGMVKVPGTQQTRELKCENCHERLEPKNAGILIPARVGTTQRNEQLQVKFPGHKACVECHVIQFTSRPFQTCSICHNQDQDLPKNPPQRDFPLRTDFNAFYDAKQHEAHGKYKLPDGKELKCDVCHKPTAKQAGLTIPSHAECYVCHTPKSADQKASLKSDCSVCHKLPTRPEEKEPFSTKYLTLAYGAHFSHKTHIGYAKEDCLACHTISGNYNQPAPRTIQTNGHRTEGQLKGRGCFSCHDGVKQYQGHPIFSGDETDKCKKCHTLPNNKIKKEVG